MLLDIGPVGDGRASDDPLGLKYGLEQRVTEKREQLALQLDNLGQYDGRLLLHEVEDSAADGAPVADGGDSGGGGLDAGGDGVDGNSDGVAAAGVTKEEMEARLRQERRDLMLTLRKTDIGYLQRESFGKTKHVIERINQVDDVKRSSQGEVPGSRLLEAEGALMEAEGRSPTSPLPGRRSSGGNLIKIPSTNSAAADAAAASPPVPNRRVHQSPDSPKGRKLRSSRGTLPEGTPPVSRAVSSLSREQCDCRDLSGRGAAASAAPSHRAAPGLAACASHTSTGPPSSALISPSPQAAPGAAPSRQAAPGAPPARRDLRVALGLTPSQRADAMAPPHSAVPPPKVAEGSWRELCTYSAPVAQKASSAPVLNAGSLSTAPPAVKKARSLSIMADEGRDPYGSQKITVPSAAPSAVPAVRAPTAQPASCGDAPGAAAVAAAAAAAAESTSGRLRAAEAAKRLSVGFGGGSADAAPPARQVQAVAQTAGPGALAAAVESAVCYTSAGLKHRHQKALEAGAYEAAAAAAAEAAQEGVPGLRRECSGGAQAVADQAARSRPMKGVPRTEEDHALCVAAAYALLGLRSPTGERPVPVLRASAGHASKSSTRDPLSASKMNWKPPPRGAPPPVPPSGFPPNMQGSSQRLGVSRAQTLADLTGGNPSANAALFLTMPGGVPPQPPQPGQAMLSHIRKINLSQEAQQPRPASVARALSRARGEMSETERAARSSASTQEPRSAAGTTDPMQAKPACSA